MAKEESALRDKSQVDSYPLELLHQLLQFPTFILVEEGMVDKDFDLRMHNEVWEFAYPRRFKSTKAQELLINSCLGKVTTEDELNQLKEELKDA